MYVSAATLLPYLMDRGLMTPGEIANDDVSVLEAGRRNRNFKVFQKKGTGLFIKQIAIAIPETINSLAREAELLQLAQVSPHLAGIRDLTPKFRHYDPERHLLVMDLVPDGISLTEFHARHTQNPEIAEQLARQIGEILAACHTRTRPDLAEAEGARIFQRRPPWILMMIDAAETVMPNMTAGCRELVAHMRAQPNLRAHFTALRTDWIQGALIHADIKWDNFLILAPKEAPEQARLQLMDWELADIGDPAWDVGAVLASYVLPILVGVPDPNSGENQAGPLDPAQYASSQACCRAFWKSYTTAAQMNAQQRSLVLWRSLRYGAARLVLTAYEMTQNQDKASPEAKQAVEIGAAMLNDPQSALNQLYTLSGEI